MKSNTWADVAIPALLVLAWLFVSPLPSQLLSRLNKNIPWKSSPSYEEHNADELKQPDASAGYILPVMIHHSRMLPRTSQHSFRYPSLYLAMDVDLLEQGSLQLGTGGRLFSWSPVSQLWSLTRLDPAHFGRKTFAGLSDEAMSQQLSGSMLLKILYEIRARRYLSVGPQDISALELNQCRVDGSYPWVKEVGKVWAVAMPSLLGMGGFNPLTVYYIYKPRQDENREGSGPLWLVVLEVHNTFNERHVYICQVGVDEDREVATRRGYQHAWTFPRAFHVSPFNDRSGYYQLLMSDLWHPDTRLPALDIRLLLLTESFGEEEGGPADVASSKEDKSPSPQLTLQKKLLATLASQQAGSATLRPTRTVRPLTSGALIASLLSQPFDLILPVSRIMLEAAKLHWKCRLPVYIRPEQVGEGVRSVEEEGEEEEEKRGKIDALRKASVPFDGTGWPIDHNPTQPLHKKSSSSGAIYWNDDTFVERACQAQFEQYLIDLTKEQQDITICIQSRNAEVPSALYSRGARQHNTKISTERCLTFHTLSSGLYLDFALFPPAQARLFGSVIDRIWGVSSIADFDNLFYWKRGAASTTGVKLRWQNRIAHWTRRSHMQWATNAALAAANHDDATRKAAEYLLSDVKSHPYDTMTLSNSFAIALLLHYILIRLTVTLSSLFHVHYVRTPWAQVCEGLQLMRGSMEK